MVTAYHVGNHHLPHTDEYSAGSKKPGMKWRGHDGGAQQNVVLIPVFSKTDAVLRTTAYKYP